MNLLKRFANSLAQLITFGRWSPFPPDRDRYGPGVDRGTADHAEVTAVDRVRKATHPDYKGHFGKLAHRLIQGIKRAGQYPVLAGDVAGYYVPEQKCVYIVHDNGFYVLEVWIHECAHYIEHMLGLAPPWHYPKWAGKFIFWRTVSTVVAALTQSPGARTRRHLEILPGVRQGEHVIVDFADGDQHLYICRATEMEEMAA